MNRRQFSQGIGVGLIGAGPFPQRSKAADASGSARSEKKEWAREHLKGLGSLILPSFTPDFKSLDEPAIRHDIRHSIQQGFTSCTVSANGASADQTKRMWELVREEAAGKIGMGALGGDFAHLEKIGCTYAMIAYPRNVKAETEDEAYSQFRKLIDSTSMAIVLYGSPVEALRRFHPT